MNNSDTIVALATSPNPSALAIIRISGPDAKKAAASFFIPAKAKNLKPRMLTLGWIEINMKKIDQAMAVFMPNPNSFTGEDTVELHLHGSLAVVNIILKELTNLDYVRAAEPGEFTKKAFFNNKLDLIQAEAVAELIASKNEKTASNASYQLNGYLSNIINECKKDIVRLSAYYIANLDFSEEDIPSLLPEDAKKILTSIEEKITIVLNNSKHQTVVREGFKIALVGLPNAGKSTLLNSLIGYERAIVTDTAGTTRDVLTESINIDGIDYVFTDTAGLRKSNDKIEQIGIIKTEQEILSNDHIFLLIEPHKQTESIEYLKNNNLLDITNNKRTTIVFTKNDIKTQKPIEYFKEYSTISISKDNLNFNKTIITRLKKITKDLEIDTVHLLTARQSKLLQNALTSIITIEKLIDSKITDDVVLIELQQLVEIFNTLSGEHASEEMIAEVFSNFCIGK